MDHQIDPQPGGALDDVVGPGFVDFFFFNDTAPTEIYTSVNTLSLHDALPIFLRTRRHHIYRVELTVYGFYKRRRASFFSMIGLDLASHVTSVVEVYVTLTLLGFVPQITAAYIIESLTKVINFAFGFVPGTIGVYETGNGIILRTLGYTAAIGVALAIVRKAAIVFWTVIGVF